MLLLPGYQLREGSGLERTMLVKFMQLTYQELFPNQENFSHLSATVDQYFSKKTPLWGVEVLDQQQEAMGKQQSLTSATVGCLWLGNVVDQVKGDRHAHIFLLYVTPSHRRRGIGSALMCHAENWAKARGDRQIGLQVFQTNQPALSLYQRLGFQTQSFWMVKPLHHS
ncbi:MAG: GNAT family N-acetyltransferase [Chamaesiphon sp.]